MSAEIVQIKDFGDYLDYVYGGEENVKNLSDDEVKSVLNLTTAIMLLSDQMMLLHQSAIEYMATVVNRISERGQNELAEDIWKNIRDWESLSALPLSRDTVYHYNQASVQTILLRTKRMPHGVYVQWASPDDGDAEEGGEIGCYVEPCTSKEVKE